MDYPHALVSTNQLAVQIKVQQFPYPEGVQLLVERSSKVAYGLQGRVSDFNATRGEPWSWEDFTVLESSKCRFKIVSIKHNPNCSNPFPGNRHLSCNVVSTPKK